MIEGAATPVKPALRSWLTVQESRSLSDLGLLAVRLIVGFELFAHGMQKFGQFGGTTTFDGHSVSGVRAINEGAQFLHLLGYHPTVALSWLLTVTELSAGVLLMAGFLTPLAAAAAIGDMFNVVFGLAWQMSWFGNAKGPGYELEAVLLVAAISICLLGPGRYSVDRRLGWRLSGVPWGVIGVGCGVAVGLFVLTVLGPGLGGADIPAPPGP